MKQLILISLIASTLSACGHGGSIGVDAEKMASESDKSDSSLSKEKAMSLSNANSIKKSKPALQLLGDGATEYVEPVFKRGTSRVITSLADYLAYTDKHRLAPSLSSWQAYSLKLKPNDIAIALMSSSLSPALGWPRGYSPESRSSQYFIIAATADAYFSNNLYSKSSTELHQTALKNQGDAKAIEIDFISSMSVVDLENIFTESIAQARIIQRSAKVDGKKGLGNLGWASGSTIFGDQSGWHIQKGGSSYFGGDVIDGETVLLSMDNTLDSVMSTKKINSESAETSNGQTTKASASLK